MEETTLQEAHSEEVKSDGEGTGSSQDEGRKLDPVEMQKTVNRLFNEKAQIQKELEAVKEQVAKAGVDPVLADKVREVETRLRDVEFYRQNPDYEPYKNIIAKFGNDPAEVVKQDEFKSIFEKVSSFDKSQQTKSVLETNPRLGQVTDKLTKAKEAVKAGDHNAAKQNAVGAVMDAFQV